MLYRQIQLAGDAGVTQVDLRVRPFHARRGDEPVLLVFLEDSRHDKRPADPEDVVIADDRTRQRVQDLEQELQYTRENLQATIEELETSNEELQATNEELLASNEELQSTNEELQSVNEELYTVNAEYQSKIGELTELNNDMDNLLRTTRLSTLFLDADLRIRKFTQSEPPLVNVVNHDVDRPLGDLAIERHFPGLTEAAQRVIAGGAPTDREYRLADGRWALMRVLPYRTLLEGRAGVLVTFVDVSAIKWERDHHERLHAMLEHVDEAVLCEDLEGVITEWSAAAQRVYGYTAQEAVGRHVSLLVPQERRSEVGRFIARVSEGRRIERLPTVRRTREGR